MKFVPARKRRYGVFAFALTFGLLSSFTAQRALAEPSVVPVAVVPVRERIVLDAADGQLDNADLFFSAMAISGARDTSEIAEYHEQLAYFERRLQQRLESCHGELERAATILRFMHDRVFVGDYDAGCCDLRCSFDDGTFNCVTATILFQTLSRRNGLHVVAVALPGHVRCRLRLPDDSSYDIETTSRQGTAQHEWPNLPTTTCRELSEIELLAKLIYNQGLAFLGRMEYSKALEATELAWQLDPQHESARENVAVVVNNWSLQLSGKGEFASAIQLLEQGREMAPDYELLTSNQIHVYLRWMEMAQQTGGAAEVTRIRKLAQKRFPGHSAWTENPSLDRTSE